MDKRILILVGSNGAGKTTFATPPPAALAALAALRRARLRAIEIARATNTCLIVYRNGQIVRIPPHELPVE
jgi:ABC-type branched-subunit amino acid transport system ATPase component